MASKLNQKEKDSLKRKLIAVARWAAKNAGVRVQFDIENGGKANVVDKIIHMPTRIPVEMVDVAITTIIHESMHIMHTPKFLHAIARGPGDKVVMNAIEDERIESIACKQLPALDNLLACSVRAVRSTIDADKVPEGLKILGNFSVQASGEWAFGVDCGQNSMYQKSIPLLATLKAIHRRVCTVNSKESFKKNIEDYYMTLDKIKKLLKVPEKEEKNDQNKQGIEPGEGEAGMNLPGQPGSALQGDKTAKGCSDEKIDLSRKDTNFTDLELSQMARQRIKEALTVSITRNVSDGTQFHTDNITSYFSGEVEPLFNETIKKRTSKTKVYFLIDISGSMDYKDIKVEDVTQQKVKDTSRFTVATTAMNELRMVVDEVASEVGDDVCYDIYMFGDYCQKWNNPSYNLKDAPSGGGGTNLPKAMQTVFSDIRTEGWAGKRILLVITDGDVHRTDINSVKELINKEAQDIRVVFVGISGHLDKDYKDLIPYNMDTVDRSSEVVFNAFEQAL